MKVRDLMSKPVIRIHAEEPVSVAARTLTQYNIGAMPVCDNQGRLCGFVTDRDVVTRCVAAQRSPERTFVREVMTAQVLSVSPDTDAAMAAHIMGKHQVRRLPVVEKDRLCGMITLADLANSNENSLDAADALTDITGNISCR